MRARRRGLLASFAALLLVLASSARATVMLQMSVTELAQTSDVVVVGRVVHTEARVERGGIVTHVTLLVDDWWAGSDASGARAPTVELLVHGGRVGDRAQIVDGQATFAVGEDVVVFLFEGGGALWPQGMSQGKWRVTVGADGVARVTSQADARSLVRRDADGRLVTVPAADAHESLTLDALRVRVRAARLDRR